jgi:TRAP-type C4-dicarboxylate transport system substrate-binding protein
MLDRDADATKRIRAAGVEVLPLSPQAREQFRQLSLKVHEKFADRVDKDYLRRVYAEIEKATKK